MATIYDVAKRAGVSTKTVSRVINNSPNIKETTRKKILRIIDEMGYVPNIYAQGISSGRTRILGIYRCDRQHFFALNPTFFDTILGGFESKLSGTGYRLLLDGPWLHGDNVPSLRVLSHQVDGLLIINTPNANEREQLAAVDGQIPVVTIGRRKINGKEMHAVGQDNSESAAVAVRHLASLGHRRIGLAVGDGQEEHDHDRIAGYQSAMSQLGLHASPMSVIQLAASKTNDQSESLADWLSRSERPTAVFAGTELIAHQLIQTARRLHLAIPDDLAIVTFEDGYAAELFDPPLSVIRRPAHQLGEEAATMLLALVDGQQVDERVRLLDPELIVRGSCGGRKNPEP